MDIVLPMPEQCVNSPPQLPRSASNMQAGLVLWSTWADIPLRRQWLMYMRLMSMRTAKLLQIQQPGKTQGTRGQGAARAGKKHFSKASTTPLRKRGNREALSRWWLRIMTSTSVACIYACTCTILPICSGIEEYLWKSRSLQSAFLFQSIHFSSYLHTNLSTHRYICICFSFSLSLSLCIACMHACNARQLTGNVM